MKLFRKTRNERLADHYIEASGIAGIWIDDATGDTGGLHVVSIDRPLGRRIYCLASFSEAMALARQCYLYRDMTVEQRAEKMGIALTAHSDVIERANRAVDAVNATMKQWQDTGGMASINSAFKARRKIEPSLRYQDWLHRHKELMLETMAREIGK
jgi:hypothetical protein